jgi:superfamily II DNA or RNA helicase
MIETVNSLYEDHFNDEDYDESWVKKKLKIKSPLTRTIIMALETGTGYTLMWNNILNRVIDEM